MKQLLWTIPFLLACFGCSEPDFISTFSRQPPKPVIQAIQETDSVAKISIDVPVWVSDPAFHTAVPNAIVYLTIDGIQHRLHYDRANSSEFSSYSSFRAGNSVRIKNEPSTLALEVQIPGFSTYRATSAGFEPVADAALDTVMQNVWSTTIDRVTYYESRYRVRLTNVSENQYFLISTVSAYLPGKTWRFQNETPLSIDIPVSRSFRYRSDADNIISQRFPYWLIGIRGSDLKKLALSTFTLSAVSRMEDRLGADLLVVYEVEPDVYAFYEALSLEGSVNSLPLAEPVQIPMNITGGLGIFGRVHAILNIPTSPAGRDRLAGRI